MTQIDPIARFAEAYARAAQSETFDAARCALATATKAAVPSLRFVLVKEFDARGFVFYTNLESRKAEELAQNPVAALAFHWSTIGLQVRVEGTVEAVEPAQADAYFAHRPRGSQIGAWASAQSKPIETRAELEARVAQLTETYADGDVPRPPFWSGFRVVPARIEFWHDRDDRLHDRFLYTRVAEGWTETRLSP